MSKFNWEEYFSLAEELAKKDSEEYARASISRAYYAIYNVIRLGLRLTNKKGDGSPHKLVIDILKDASLPSPNDLPELTDDEWWQIGSKLEFLRDRRNKADYDTHANITQKDAIEIIQTVSALLEKLKETF